MDIAKKIAELVDKIQNDKNLIAKFQKNPVATVESLLGIDLPDDQINAIVEGVKAKISVDKLGDILGGLGNILGKK